MYYKPKQLVKDPEPERNAKCPCGSGLKYKKCCLIKINQLAKVKLRGERAERRGK